MSTNGYEDLAARVERGQLQAVPDTVRRGADAAAGGLAALLAAPDAESIEDATQALSTRREGPCRDASGYAQLGAIQL